MLLEGLSAAAAGRLAAGPSPYLWSWWTTPRDPELFVHPGDQRLSSASSPTTYDARIAALPTGRVLACLGRS